MERLHGSARFGALFILTGILGFVASDVYHQGLGFTAGASGALFGLIGGRVGYLLAARDPRWKQLAGRAVVYGVLFAIAFPVNNAAHAGGFVSGIALGALLYVEQPVGRWSWLYAPLTALLLLASVGSIVLAQMSTAWREVRQLEIDGRI
jgi:membrane associated rhomboid family serine protease